MKIYHISLSLSPQCIRWVTSQPMELIERKRTSRGRRQQFFFDPCKRARRHPCGRAVSFRAGGQNHRVAASRPFYRTGAGVPVDVGTHITAADVAKAGVQGESRVLFKTRNSTLLKKGVYDPTFAAFSVDGAKALVEAGVKLVGLDYLSAAKADEQVPVHRAFLDYGVILLEGVDLSDVPPGRYELICPPVKLAGSDGAPCRAVLRELA